MLSIEKLMKSIVITYFHRLLTGILICLPMLASAQSSSESVYSDQAFDPIREKIWYEDPIIWGGALLIAAIVFFWYRRRR